MARDIDVRTSGPVFDGRADRALEDFIEAAGSGIAEEGAGMVRQNLHQVLRHPTGYYESRVRAQGHGALAEVTDGGVVYGPWLEGTGERNKTTRFKGYATFRRTAQQLQAKAGDIAEEILPRYTGGME